MIGPLSRWARGKRMITLVLLLAAGTVTGSTFLAYVLVSRAVEPSKTPPPVIVSVYAAYAGASAEEMERQVTIPLEVTLAGMPRLKAVYSQSQFGFSYLDCEFEAGADHQAARQEVINRLQLIQNLPPGVSPLLYPSYADPVLRYTLSTPRDELNQDVYTPGDLLALQEWHIATRWRRQPFIVDVTAHGGADKRYEIALDPERMKRYGVTPQQLRDALVKNNANAGGDFLLQGPKAKVVRSVGLIGGGRDPMEKAVAMKTATEAGKFLRAEESKRLGEIRKTVITSVNNVPIVVEDLVEGGPLGPGQAAGKRGVVVGQRPRAGHVSVSRLKLDARGNPVRDADGKAVWIIEPDTVQGIVLKRRSTDADARVDLPALIEKFNSGREPLLPGVKLIAHAGRERAVFVHGLYPGTLPLKEVAERALLVHSLLREFPEVEAVISGAGRADAQPGLAQEVEFYVALKPPATWPAPAGRDRPRSRDDLLEAVRAGLSRQFPGVDWYCSPTHGPRSMAPFACSEGECLLKIFGPDLRELDKLAASVKQKLSTVKGIACMRLFPISAQSRLDFVVDRDKCRRLGVQVADVNTALAMAGGLPVTQMIEGEKTFDIVLRWPAQRVAEAALLDLPVYAEGKALRLRDLVTIPKDGPGRLGPACIYREKGKRLSALKLRVTGRPVAAALAEAQALTADLCRAPYQAEWRSP